MFITIEGMDGSGKTTVSQKLQMDLQALGYEVVLTREPGGLVLCEKIRNLLLNKNQNQMEPWTEALLFIAARKEHLEKLIKPALSANKIVISDRFLDSTTAYQGGGRDLGVQFLQTFQETILDGFMPDLTLYLDLPFAVAEQRIAKRQEKNNRLDEESQVFKHKVHAAFAQIIANSPKRIKVIDASQTLDDVYYQVKSTIVKEIKLWNSKHSN